MRLSGGDHVVVGLVLLQHPPHRLDVVAGEAPVAAGLEVAQREALLQAERDPGDGPGHLAGDELVAAARALVVEQDAGGGVRAVGLAVVDRHVVAEGLGHAVGGARVERASSRVCGTSRTLPNISEDGRLVEAHPAHVVLGGDADRLEHPQHAHAGDLAGQLGLPPGQADEADRGQVVDLVGLRRSPSRRSGSAGRSGRPRAAGPRG